MSEIIEYLSIYSEYSDFLRNIRHFTEYSSKKGIFVLIRMSSIFSTSVSAEYSAELFRRILVRNRIRFNTAYLALKCYTSSEADFLNKGIKFGRIHSIGHSFDHSSIKSLMQL